MPDDPNAVETANERAENAPEPAPLTAASRSASSSTSSGALPPSSSTEGLRCAAQCRAAVTADPHRDARLLHGRWDKAHCLCRIMNSVMGDLLAGQQPVQQRQALVEHRCAHLDITRFAERREVPINP